MTGRCIPCCCWAAIQYRALHRATRSRHSAQTAVDEGPDRPFPPDPQPIFLDQESRLNAVMCRGSATYQPRASFGLHCDGPRSSVHARQAGR
eukprot:6175577-Pleurochrysis_carterae.AAC.2